MNLRCLVGVLACIIGFNGLGQNQLRDLDYLIDANQNTNVKSEYTGFYIISGLELEHVLAFHDMATPVRRYADSVWVVELRDFPKASMSQSNLLKANNLWKLSNNIFWLRPDQKYSCLVKTISDDIEPFMKKYQESNIIHLQGGLYRVDLSPETAKELADEAWVQFISYEALEPKTESRVIDLNLNPNRVFKLQSTFPLLQGQGITISIQERAYDINDLDLIGRHISSDLMAMEVTGHATEMATMIAGAGNSFVTGKGVAPAALITSSDFEVALPDKPESYDLLNISVQNHSYGTIVESFYGLEAQAFDQIAQSKPELLHVFSSGNSGLEVPEEGAYQGVAGFANLTGNFKAAKNILLVGSVDSVGREVSFVSRGPAYDGRVKPDISAYSMVGSSNSAALVSGTVALMQQSFFQNYGKLPSSDLIKGLLVTGSDDLDQSGPDHVRGFGNLNAHKSMILLKNGSFYSDTIRAGENVKIGFKLPGNVAQLKVGLVWIDPPANPYDDKTLVNNLDLTVIGPGGVTYEPWILMTDADPDILAAPAVRGKDVLNNVELVSIELPAEGSYTFQIGESGMLSASQAFSLVYSVDTLDHFEWDYPNHLNNFPYNGETGTYFRWQSTMSTNIGLLQYRWIEDAEWTDLRQVELSEQAYRWERVPLSKSGLAEARMIVGTDTFLTEQFTISAWHQSTVGFSCGDSLELQWEVVDDAAYYNVYQPGERYLEMTNTTVSNSIILSKAEIQSDYFSIEPVRGDGVAYLPTYTFDYKRQGAGCFLSSFYQEVVLDEGIYLNLELGSIHGVKQVVFEAKRNGKYAQLQTIEQLEKRLRILDPLPNQGYNEHRVTIYFKNGQQLEEIAGDTYYLTDKASLVFPNPAKNSESLNVYTKAFNKAGVHFSLFDRVGAKVLDQPLRSTQEAIPLYDLRAGLYFYLLEADGNRYRGKLIIQ